MVCPYPLSDKYVCKCEARDKPVLGLRAAVVLQGHMGQDIVLVAISSVVRGALALADCDTENYARVYGKSFGIRAREWRMSRLA
jgi:hypothetical protein